MSGVCKLEGCVYTENMSSFSNNSPRRSTAMQLNLSLAGIALAALVATAVAMLATDTLRGDAAAINLAGSMRMQSYRILTSRLKQDPAAELDRQIALYEEKLHDLLLERRATYRHSEPFKAQLTLLKQDWEQALKPALLDPNRNADDVSAMVESYVTRIDQAVQLLQQESEAKVKTLSTLQAISLLVLFSLSALLLVVVHRKWVTPLRQFMHAVQRLQEGNFSTRVQYPYPDELGLLGDTINRMAEQLAELYSDLEQRVKNKTRQLQQSNESLRLLHETSRRLFSKPDDFYQAVPQILAEVQSLMNLGAVSLCLRKQDSGPAYRLITSDHLPKPSFCRKPDCDNCRAQADKTVFAPHLKEVVMFPVSSDQHHVGDISVELHPGQSMQPWQRNLLCALSEVFATTQSLAQLSHQHSQLALAEERAAIARELHDSLAQSLSSQKMQTARLRKLLEKAADTNELNDTIDQVQEGLNESYRQLRELISTFRINVNEPEFERAVRKAIDAAAARFQLQISLDYGIGHCPLNANEETHCLHIIREALSNVGKHARASHAHVSIRQQAEGPIELRIEDNGIGLSADTNKPNHFGLSILAERSHYLNGYLAITRPDQGGTLVNVTFEPKYLNNLPKPNHVTEVSTDRISSG